MRVVVDAAREQAGEDLNTLLDNCCPKEKHGLAGDRDAVLNVLVAPTGMGRAEATRRVESWETPYQQARVKAAQLVPQGKQGALQAAATTAGGASRGALRGFVALVLGAAAAAWGGSVGRPRAAS